MPNKKINSDGKKKDHCDRDNPMMIMLSAFPHTLQEIVKAQETTYRAIKKTIFMICTGTFLHILTFQKASKVTLHSQYGHFLLANTPYFQITVAYIKPLNCD